MVLVTLFAALVCLILGLVFASGPWLIGSLAASGLAAIILWRQRDQHSAGAHPRPPDSGTAAAVTGTAAGAATTAGPAEGAASTARHRPRPTPGSAGRTVWVVDGRPRYHLETCLIIQEQDAEMIPLEQAVEDGFIPCSMCDPFVSRV